MPENTRRSLVELIKELPQLFLALVRAELNQLKKELTAKAISASKGIALLAGAFIILMLVVPVLVTAAILGFSVIVPAWAAALIVAGILLILVAALAFAGIRYFKRTNGAAPADTIASVKNDVDAVKGVGDYDK